MDYFKMYVQLRMGISIAMLVYRSVHVKSVNAPV